MKLQSPIYLLLFFFLFLNVFFSQNISPLYYSFVTEDKKAAVEFLKSIKNTDYFSEELNKYKNIYGPNIESLVFAQDTQRKQKIINVEAALEKNQKARDVLYDLYLLYSEDGNEIRAQEYLKQAREVDPDVGD